jgi:hypothetical protein
MQLEAEGGAVFNISDGRMPLKSRMKKVWFLRRSYEAIAVAGASEQLLEKVSEEHEISFLFNAVEENTLSPADLLLPAIL